MARHVFLSFVQEDLTLVRLFRGQARNKQTALVFDDYSVTTPYNSTDATYIRSQITKRLESASTTICLIGTHTASSKWVDWEVQKSIAIGNNTFGVRLYAGVSTPSALVAARAPIVNWDINAIVSRIG